MLTIYRGYVKLPSMEDVRQRVIRKFLAMSEDKLSDSKVELMTNLKADWEAKPENTGKFVTYSELWDEHARKMKALEGALLSETTQNS